MEPVSPHHVVMEPDVHRLLAEGHNGILTTLRRDGWPVSLPIWFVVRDDEIFAMSTGAAKRSQRIRANAKVSFLVEGGSRPSDLHGVHVTGLAVIDETPGLKDDIEEMIKTKYESFRPRDQHPTSARDCIRITPVGRIAWWDHRTR